jgi:hypothetical protein
MGDAGKVMKKNIMLDENTATNSIF